MTLPSEAEPHDRHPETIPLVVIRKDASKLWYIDS